MWPWVVVVVVLLASVPVLIGMLAGIRSATSASTAATVAAPSPSPVAIQDATTEDTLDSVDGYVSKAHAAALRKQAKLRLEVGASPDTGDYWINRG